MKLAAKRHRTETVFDARGSLVLFGHAPRAATVSLFEHDRGQRLRRAALFVALGLVLAPVVVLVPPHIPWLLGALTGSAFLAWRALNGRFAVVSVDGRCPRCGAPIEVKPGTRLRAPHPLHCGACHHELVLRVDPDELPEGR